MEPVVLGIVVEFNPYHLGHQYFISQAKALINPNVMIAITSTSFSMRGEIAIVDKFTKTEQMLAEGIDIVLELPCAKSVQSADFLPIMPSKPYPKCKSPIWLSGWRMKTSRYFINC